MIAALFVEPDGVYANLPGVDIWPKERDARLYAGPWPVVSHTECQRWGRFSEGGPAAPGTCKTGDDGGCFEASLRFVRMYGGVIEHPKDSKAWNAEWFDLVKPPPTGGWVRADDYGGWTCCVDQGWYGHFSNKRTWLYACKVPDLPSLIWGKHPQRINARALELHGYAKARRIGNMAMVGGKDKTKIRNSTPAPFRDVLIAMAESVNQQEIAA